MFAIALLAFCDVQRSSGAFLVFAWHVELNFSSKGNGRLSCTEMWWVPAVMGRRSSRGMATAKVRPSSESKLRNGWTRREHGTTPMKLRLATVVGEQEHRPFLERWALWEYVAMYGVHAKTLIWRMPLRNLKHSSQSTLVHMICSPVDSAMEPCMHSEDCFLLYRFAERTSGMRKQRRRGEPTREG